MTSIENDRRVAFRTTAGRSIGLGHLRRCLTLANELADRGFESIFWLDGDEEADEMVARSGFLLEKVEGTEPEASVELLKRHNPRGIVVDSYALDSDYFCALRSFVGCVIAIDDLADRTLDVDLVVNGSANAQSLSYRVGPNCRRLLGARYALLRPAFRDRPLRRCASIVRTILVTLGGADPTRSTSRIVETVLESVPEAVLDVVIGPFFPDTTKTEVNARHSPGRLVFHRAPENLADLMTSADLAVSAGGQTLYELAACGLPTVAVCVAENQRGQLDALAALGAVARAGDCDLGGHSPLVGAAAARLAADAARRQRMSEAGQNLVDGWGAFRVADAIVEEMGRSRRTQDAGS